ncbi:hypothetical protein KJ632_03290 [Patescibacteria group bacterium]|nr:hypothetical protein [Patescibacteria group bacterium]
MEKIKPLIDNSIHSTVQGVQITRPLNKLSKKERKTLREWMASFDSSNSIKAEKKTVLDKVKTLLGVIPGDDKFEGISANKCGLTCCRNNAMHTIEEDSDKLKAIFKERINEFFEGIEDRIQEELDGTKNGDNPNQWINCFATKFSGLQMIFRHENLPWEKTLEIISGVGVSDIFQQTKNITTSNDLHVSDEQKKELIDELKKLAYSTLDKV